MTIEILKQVITTLKEIQEGCGNVVEDKLHDHAISLAKMVRKDCDKAITALHQAIQQVQRIPLTDDEIKKIWGSYFSRGMEFARAIEAAHGIRSKE